jgi:hypothetical protein
VTVVFSGKCSLSPALYLHPINLFFFLSLSPSLSLSRQRYICGISFVLGSGNGNPTKSKISNLEKKKIGFPELRERLMVDQQQAALNSRSVYTSLA